MPQQRKYAFLAVISLFTCTFSFYIFLHREGKTRFLDDMLIGASGTFQEGVFSFGKGVRSLFENYVNLVHAKKNNEELQKEVDSLKSNLTHYTEMEIENKRLRESLDLKSRVTHKLLSAQVVAHDVSSDYYSLRIDRGIKDGVKEGMGVVSPRGVVGRIFKTTDHYSDVLTLIDPTSNLDVVIQRSRVRGILSGQNKQLLCRLKYIDRLEDVLVNDIIVSTDFGTYFPKGLLVGYVTQANYNANGIQQTVVVKPAVDIYRLEEVFVVFPTDRSTEKIIN